MINIQKEEDCCGCTACYNICPTQCISLVENQEGFLYPKVQNERCIQCGRCIKVCPMQDVNNKSVDYSPLAYAVRNRNLEILRKSTSGGVFTAIGKYIIQSDGVVYGAAFENNWIVTHMSADPSTPDNLSKFRGSKYVQSYLGSTFKEVEDYLRKGRLVCFSGTPCQINGLKKYLNKEYENLYLVDLVCKGVASPHVWKSYINYQIEKYKSKLISVSFRKKVYGYHSSAMELTFINGKVYHGSGRIDMMLRSYYHELCSRPSCHSCPFKGHKNQSDITLFDCWSFTELTSLKDDDCGYTNLMVNTNHGNELVEKCRYDLELIKIDIDKALDLDGCRAKTNALPHTKRKIFFKELKESGLVKALCLTDRVTCLDYFKENCKIILFKLQLWYRVKKLLGKTK